MKMFTVTIFVINLLLSVSSALDVTTTSGRDNNRNLVAFPRPRMPGRKLEDTINDIPNVDFTFSFDQNSNEQFWTTGCEGDYKEIHEAMEAISPNDYALFFKVKGNYAIGAGVIVDNFPERVNTMLAANPQVKSIILVSAPGSDVSTVAAGEADAALIGATLIHKNKISTCVPSDGNVESGGTDLFLAGWNRYASKGAKVGIHSWVQDDTLIGSDLPRDHPEHVSFINYYKEICIPEQFYWDSLEGGVPMYYIKESEYATRFQYMRDCNDQCDAVYPIPTPAPNTAPNTAPTKKKTVCSKLGAAECGGSIACIFKRGKCKRVPCKKLNSDDCKNVTHCKWKASNNKCKRNRKRN